MTDLTNNYTPENPINDNQIDTTIEQNTNKKDNKSLAALIISIIALVGVIVLLILQIGTKTDKIDLTHSKLSSSGGLKIAYINNDSILQNYSLVKEMHEQLESKTKRYESDITSKMKVLEKEVAYFEEQVQKQTISNESAQEIYAQIMQKQQDIYKLQEQYSLQLQKEELELNIALIDTVMNFLSRYNNNYKFDYILGINKGGNVLLANDTLDITDKVLKELNEEYRIKNKSKK
ncbi:MAG: OmpH family outer membrane protein [Bacteroidales bacterium]